MGANDVHDVIIIGAGIGGLTAGNILAKNGMKVLILEKNHVPGGAVTTYYRDGYPIDICHAMCAITGRGFIRKYFEYLGILNKIEFIELEKTFIHFNKTQDRQVFCYSEADRYVEELVKHFPGESTKIRSLFSKIENIWRNEVLKSYYNPSLWDLLCRYPHRYPSLFKYRNYTFEQFLDSFGISAELKSVLSVGWPYLGLDKEQISALFMICLFGGYHFDRTFLIKGGFGKLTEALADNFKENNGTLICNKKVKTIMVNKRNTAYGVIDTEGNSYLGNKIISNIDSKKTLLDLIPKDRLSNSALRKVKKLKMSCSIIQTHIAVKTHINNELLSAGSIMYQSHLDLEKSLRKMLRASDENRYNSPVSMMSIHNINNFIQDRQNSTYIFNLGWFSANYNLWSDFVSSFKQADYEDLKGEIANDVVTELSKTWKFEKIEMKNVLTPISFEKWLNASEGAIYDLASFPEQSFLKRMQYEQKIKNLFMVGAKTFPGHGMTCALISAFSISDIFLQFKLTKRKVVLPEK